MAVNEPETAGLIYQHQDRIYRYVLTLIRDPADAEDLTQDALFRAYRSYASLRDPAALTSWLCLIATNVCYDRLRQHVRRAPLLGEVDP